jgi:hypothetical protein
LASFLLFTVWRIQTGADARICPVGSQSLSDWCTIGEISIAFVFDLLWALYGLPFALVLTAPCAIGLGRLAPLLEQHLEGRALALVQFGLGLALGLVAGIFLEAVVAGLVASGVGVWVFRHQRYGGKSATTDVPASSPAH